MSRLVQLSLLTWVGVAGCHETVSISQPPLQPGESVVLADPDKGLLWAVDGSEESPTLPTFAGVPAEMSALAFSCSLDVMGMTPGQLTQADPPPEVEAPLNQKFAPWHEVLRYDVDNDSWPEGELSSATLGLLSQAELSPHWCTLATPVEEELIGVRVDSDNQIPYVDDAREVADGRIMVSTSFSGDLFQTSTTGFATYLFDGINSERLDPSITAEALLTSFDQDDGTWFALDRHALYQGTGLDLRTLTTTQSGGPGFRAAAMTGAPSGPPDLWILATRNVPPAPVRVEVMLLRYRNNQLETVRRLDAGGRAIGGRLKLFWVPPGDVYGLGMGPGNSVLHANDQELKFEEIDPTRGITTVGMTHLGPTALDSSGTIYARSASGVWETVSVAPRAFIASTIWQISPRRLLLTGRSDEELSLGWFNYDDEWGSCEATSVSLANQLSDRTLQTISTSRGLRRIFQEYTTNDQLAWVDLVVEDAATRCGTGN